MSGEMQLRMPIENPEALDSLIEPMRQAARIPGLAIAIVTDGATAFARGYGYRDARAKLSMSARTAYPIASTTKAINATLLGMLVDDGVLAWDVPVQSYLPRFRLGDPLTSAQVTLRDLITMRTGLPRHDWLWLENRLDRAELVERLRHLELSAGFRERFQYNNLTVTTAGHIAEIATGKRWEVLVQDRIFTPLAMSSSGFSLPETGEVTVSYHENSRRELVETQRLATESTAPSGGAIHSTVEDMARWILFNLNHGNVGGRSLIKRETLAEIHAPQTAVGADILSPPTPNAPYAMGWFVDAYNGCARWSHGGYLHDVNSEAMLFPQQGIGIVAFSNFGPPTLARVIGQHVFDSLMGFRPAQTLEEAQAAYEHKVTETRKRNAAVPLVPNTSPSHGLEDYAGTYQHAGYGEFHVHARDGALILQRHRLQLRLQHWHYDTWICAEHDLFPIHKANPFERASRILFETNREGEISAFSIQLEPAVSHVRFTRRCIR